MSKKTPILATGAVVFRGSDVLVIQRGKAPYKGHWSIPGGKVEYGEPIEEALKREVLEETGVEINILGLIDVYEALPTVHSDTHYVMADYVCEWVSGEAVPADDAEEAEFVPFSEAISRLAWDQTRKALTMAKTARARLAKED